MIIKKKLATLSVAILCSTFMMQSALAADWLVRGRIINVNPDDSSSLVSGATNTGVSVDSDTTLELDFTYMLNSNIGLELILATTKHNVTGTNSLAGVDVSSVRVLPPTLTLQYHFAPKATVRPYVGVGLNYTLFYNAKVNAGLGGTGATDIDYDSSFGLAAQAGFDVDLNKDWFMNLDVKYIKMDTTATITGGSLAGTVDVDIDPWVIGVGVGKRF